MKLSFVKGNAKLSKDIAIFNLPAGWTCPFAKACKQLASPQTGKITRCHKLKYACYAATEEMYPNVREMRWHNFAMLQKCSSSKEMRKLIEESIPKCSIVRVHSSGDFYRERYFKAWLAFAKRHPDIIVYGYTKAVPYLLKYKLPSNFKFVASYGGTYDKLIKKHKLRFAKVVYKPGKLPIEHKGDELAYNSDKSFCLLIHGTQPKGSRPALALKKLKQRGVKTGYGRT